VRAIDLDDLIDELEDTLADGRRLFFSGRLLVDEERMLDIIDRMRVAIPEEVKRARRALQEHDRLIGAAHAQVQQALEEQGLMAALEAERDQILKLAEEEAAGMRREADAYARSVLEELDERLNKLGTSVRNGLRSLTTQEPPTPEA
jgi:glutamyl-tRNA reductase